MRTVANANNITYHGIDTPAGFWKYLASMPNDSISRVWYSGHAAGDGLMLSLTHNSLCGAAAYKKDRVLVSHIKDKQKQLENKFDKKLNKVSKFYGCYTEPFAKEWAKVFNVSTAGAKQKVEFDINRPSNIVSVLERIEKTPTSVGLPDWKTHHGK